MECGADTPAVQKTGMRGRLVTRLVHGWGRLTRGMTLGVKAAVVDEGGAVLLVRHGYVPGWHLPGGGVEVGETAEEALARELREETGIIIRQRPNLHGLLLNRNLARRDHVAVYVVRDFERGAMPPPSREIAESGFFAPDRLPETTTGPTRRRIHEIVTGRPPAAHW